METYHEITCTNTSKTNNKDKIKFKTCDKKLINSNIFSENIFNTFFTSIENNQPIS